VVKSGRGVGVAVSGQKRNPPKSGGEATLPLRRCKGRVLCGDCVENSFVGLRTFVAWPLCQSDVRPLRRFG
jgi:hypothetical protein